MLTVVEGSCRALHGPRDRTRVSACAVVAGLLQQSLVGWMRGTANWRIMLATGRILELGQAGSLIEACLVPMQRGAKLDTSIGDVIVRGRITPT